MCYRAGGKLVRKSLRTTNAQIARDKLKETEYLLATKRLGLPSTINEVLKEEFKARGWEAEKKVFGGPGNDLKTGFWKRQVGADVAFCHGSYIGGDLLRFQAAAEVKNVIEVGVYVCSSLTPAYSLASRTMR
ncbi:MAG: BglII/BstYI family type II restriction endonuclease [Planctomycetota bacterium]|jgi:hypothetical protein